MQVSYPRPPLDALHVGSRATWQKEVSAFDWAYDADEMCYILEREAVVTPDEDEPIRNVPIPEHTTR